VTLTLVTYLLDFWLTVGNLCQYIIEELRLIVIPHILRAPADISSATHVPSLNSPICRGGSVLGQREGVEGRSVEALTGGGRAKVQAKIREVETVQYVLPELL